MIGFKYQIYEYIKLYIYIFCSQFYFLFRSNFMHHVDGKVFWCNKELKRSKKSVIYTKKKISLSSKDAVTSLER